MNAISKNTIVFKILLSILVTLFGILISYVLLNNQPAFIKYLIPFLILIIGFIWIYKSYTESYNVFYNTSHLILKYIKGERTILLKNIQSIKSTHNDTRVLGYQYYQFDVHFKNETAMYETVRLSIWSMNSSFSEFQDLVKSQSPNANIELFSKD